MTGGDIFFRLSGGSTNDSPAASLGGGMSFLYIDSGVIDNIFPGVPAAEVATGIEEYACIYVFNDHDFDVAYSVTVTVADQPDSGSCTIEVGADPAGSGGTATTIANREVPPSGVTFSSSASLGDLNAQEGAALWLKRIVTAGVIVLQRDSFILSVSAEET